MEGCGAWAWARRDCIAVEERGMGTLCVVEGRNVGSATIDAVGEDEVDVSDGARRCVGWEYGSIALDSPIKLSTDIPSCIPDPPLASTSNT